MSLKKQLYIIISFVFLSIFIGNFIITIQSTKSYLEEESYTKSFDTATSLGMILKKFMQDKTDPEIALTISAISDSGFYKEIRLEDVYVTITSDEIVKFSNLKNISKITDVSIDKKYGTLEIDDDSSLENELNELENIQTNLEEESANKSYIFLPAKEFSSNSSIFINFKYLKNNKIYSAQSKINYTNIIYSKNRDEKFDNVPMWFIDLIDLNIKEAKSQISDGWKTTAIIYISANSGIAYEKLYLQLEKSLIYSIIAFLISIIIFAIFLKFLLKPLENVKNLANEISNGNFIQIKNIPWTLELKSVSLAMNKMSLKIENIISQLNSNIDNMTKKLSQDSLTKLELKQSFETQMKNMFINKKSGYIFIIKINNLTKLSQTMGRNSLNEFLINFSSILKNIKDTNAYRFFGSEFAIILKNKDEKNLEKILKELKHEYKNLAKKINENNIVQIGVSSFDEFSNLGNILSSANEAYEMAKQIGPNEYYVKENKDVIHGMLEWKDIVNNIIENDEFTLEFIGDTHDLKSQNIVMQEVFSNVMDLENNIIPIGVFVSMAQKHEKIIDFDMKVINKVITHIKNDNIQHCIAINLSFEAVLDINFMQWITNILNENKNIASKLIFSLSSYAIVNNYDKTIQFCKNIKQCDSQFMIKRFEMKFIPTEILAKINPNIIRLVRDYSKDIAIDDNKLTLVDSICKMANILDIKVYAENVVGEEDFNKISSLDITCLSR